MGTYFSTPCGEKSHHERHCFACFMNEGECKVPYIKWKKCVKQAKKKKQDIVNTCFQDTCDLRECLEANKERHRELFEAEKSFGMKLLWFMKRKRLFEDDDIEELEENFPALELFFHLQDHKEAEVRRRKSKKNWWFWGN